MDVSYYLYYEFFNGSVFGAWANWNSHNIIWNLKKIYIPTAYKCTLKVYINLWKCYWRHSFIGVKIWICCETAFTTILFLVRGVTLIKTILRSYLLKLQVRQSWKRYAFSVLSITHLYCTLLHTTLFEIISYIYLINNLKKCFFCSRTSWQGGDVEIIIFW